MSSRALSFRRIAISRLPGFGINAFPPIPELRPGLNVVWGSNSVGKSSLARAMRSLIWPQAAELDAEAEADFEGQAWRFERRGERLTHERLADASRSEARWGPEEDAARYWFPLHELLQVESGQDPFASYIQRRMRWGIDLARANADAGGKRAKLTAARDEVKNLDRAERAFETLRQEQAAQQDLPDRIAELTALIDGAAEAPAQLKVLHKGIEYLGTQARVAALRLDLEAFPAGLDKLGDGDPGRLEQLAGEVDAQERAVAAAGRKGADKAAERERLGLADGFLADEAQRIRLEGLVEQVEAAQAGLAAAEREREQKRGAQAAWREEHRWLLPEPPPGALLPAMVQRLGELAAQCEPLRCQLDAAGRQLEGLGRDDEPVPVPEARLAEVQARIGDWLESDQAAARRELVPRGTVRNGLLALALLALLGLGAQWAAPSGAAAAALGLVALAAVVLGLYLARPGGPGGTAEPSAQVRLKAAEILAGLPGLVPAEWTRASALALSGEIAHLLGQARAARAQNAARQRARAAAAAAGAAYADWQARFAAETRGLYLRQGEAALDGAQFFHFSNHLLKWVELAAQAGGAAAECAHRAEQAATLRRDLQALLRANGCPEPAAEPGPLLAQGRDLLERRARALLLRREEAALARELLDARSRLEQLRGRLDGFWRDLGFAEPDPRRLGNLVDRLPEWRALRNDLTLATRQLETLLAELRGTPPAAGLAELQAEVLRLEQLQEATAAHVEARGGLRKQYETLLDGSTLASARRDLEEARAAYRRAKAENLVDRLVDHLTTRLDQRSFREDQPEVLRQASQRLLDFTRQRFWLGIDPRGRFFAHDTTKGLNFALEELSSGTRVQLLFAVRLAFIEVLEGPGAARLPLFLDEVLGNSDDLRARAIVQVLMALAEERQVFYFTAQADEVAKLREWAGPGRIHEIPLEALARTRAAALAPLSLRLAEPEPVPEPLEDYAAYGRALEVPGARLHHPLEALHAWHAFTRGRDLHPLLRQGLRTLGQLRLAMTPAQDPLGVLRRIAMLARARELALTGRGRPFLPADFARAPLARSAAYWAEWQQLVNQADGDPVAFMARAAEVKRSRKALEDFTPWMEAEGFLPSEPALDQTTVLYRLGLEFPWLDADADDLLVARRFVWAVLPEPD